MLLLFSRFYRCVSFFFFSFFKCLRLISTLNLFSYSTSSCWTVYRKASLKCNQKISLQVTSNPLSPFSFSNSVRFLNCFTVNITPSSTSAPPPHILQFSTASWIFYMCSLKHTQVLCALCPQSSEGLGIHRFSSASPAGWNKTVALCQNQLKIQSRCNTA